MQLTSPGLKEDDLVNQLKKHNEDAFKTLVTYYQNKVYNLCYSYLRSRSEAEDLAQEVFIEVYQSIGNFRERSGLGTWIYRITVNKSLEYIRRLNRNKRWAFVYSLFGKEEYVARYHRDEMHPGVKLENKERVTLLFSKIDELPEKQRTVFLLHKVEGQSYAEAAKIMETTVSSVESLMHRAKMNLRKSLREYYKSEKD